jgi:hypothetical protein
VVIDLKATGGLKEVADPATVVVVAMAEHQTVHCCKRDFQCCRVVSQGLVLAGIKEQSVVAGGKPQGKAMFGKKVRGGLIIHHYPESKLSRFHGFFSA